jgi:hypothetical protein
MQVSWHVVGWHGGLGASSAILADAAVAVVMTCMIVKWQLADVVHRCAVVRMLCSSSCVCGP